MQAYTKKTKLSNDIKKNKVINTKKRAILKKEDGDNVFSKLEIVKELGAGMLGTTYLAMLDNKQYALKIQHILAEQRHKSFKSELWREVDLYNYINKLPLLKQIFFTKLYNMQIYDNCKHIQKRPYKIPKAGQFAERMRMLNTSPWCVKYLMDYNGSQTLENYIVSSKITAPLLLSFALQIINILMILYTGGYAHNDFHPGNIMVKPTQLKTFSITNGITNRTIHNIPYKGYQLVAIDYGDVLHAKYNMHFTYAWQKLFIKNRKAFLFNEMFNSLAKLIFYDKSRNVSSNSQADKKEDNPNMIKYPWEYKGDSWSFNMKKIIIAYPKFISDKLSLYLSIFPISGIIEVNELLALINAEDTTNPIGYQLKNKEYVVTFWNIMARVHYEFMYYYPEEFATYFNRRAVVKINYDEELIIGFLRCKNATELESLFTKWNSK